MQLHCVLLLVNLLICTPGAVCLRIPLLSSSFTESGILVLVANSVVAFKTVLVTLVC